MEITYEEAIETMEKVREMLKRQGWAGEEYPQTHIRTTKNENRVSANAEERGENDTKGS